MIIHILSLITIVLSASISPGLGGFPRSNGIDMADRRTYGGWPVAVWWRV